MWTSGAELYHHGIKGQSWGVKNGPPYPLSASVAKKVRQGAFKEVPKLSKSDKEYYDKYYNNNKESDSKNTALSALVWDLITIVRLNPYGIPMLARDIVTSAQCGIGKAKHKRFVKERANEPIDKKTGFHKKTKELTEREDLQRVNPLFHNFDENTKNNCVLCTVTYDLRRRGYDVEAKTATHGFYTDVQLNKWYPKAKVYKNYEDFKNTKDMINASRRPLKERKPKYDELLSELSKQPEGARGNISVQWRNTFSGHSMIWEVKNGKVRILDGQANKVYENPMTILSKTNGNYDWARLDNVNIDPKAIQRCSK